MKLRYGRQQIVMHPSPPTLLLNPAAMAQHLQVAGNLVLALTKGALDLADAQLAAYLDQQRQDAQPGGIGQSLHQFDRVDPFFIFCYAHIHILQPEPLRVKKGHAVFHDH